MLEREGCIKNLCLRGHCLDLLKPNVLCMSYIRHLVSIRRIYPWGGGLWNLIVQRNIIVHPFMLSSHFYHIPDSSFCDIASELVEPISKLVFVRNSLAKISLSATEIIFMMKYFTLSQTSVTIGANKKRRNLFELNKGSMVLYQKISVGFLNKIPTKC